MPVGVLEEISKVYQNLYSLQFSIHAKSRETEIAFSQNSFVTSPALLCHLIRRDSGDLQKKAFASHPIVSLKQ